MTPDSAESRLARVEQRVDSVERQQNVLSPMAVQIGRLDERVGSMDERLGARVADVHEDNIEMLKRIKDVEVALDNRADREAQDRRSFRNTLWVVLGGVFSTLLLVGGSLLAAFA